ncbi:unnamed protein product [Prorocentrum cordatum]|uniref:Uncharacterized protein n=1 Tax=Prorocentrum cordatum TaxID=2364126 RepID=A0ABN9V1B3_9DINO|nr:unnamed protein product [Polarella glacialis]
MRLVSDAPHPTGLALHTEIASRSKPRAQPREPCCSPHPASLWSPASVSQHSRTCPVLSERGANAHAETRREGNTSTHASAMAVGQPDWVFRLFTRPLKRDVYDVPQYTSGKIKGRGIVL